MKKIYLDLQPTWRKKTGIGWYTFNLVEKFHKKYSKKYVLLGGIFNPLGIEKNILKIDKLLYREIKYFWPFYNYAGIFSKFFLRWIFINFNNVTRTQNDIYHFFNFTIPHNIKGKIIITIHDLIYRKLPETIGFDINLFDKEVKYSLEKADVIITVSNSTKNDLLSFFDINSEKIKIVEPGVNLKNYKKKYSIEQFKSIKQKYFIKKDSEIILYIGSIERRKNLINLIKAFNIIKDKNESKEIELVLIGKEGFEYKEILNEYNLSPYKEFIKIIGYISEEEKKIFYKMSTVFVYPSFYEGFGIPILEAMASGIPVITSNISSLPEVCGDAGILINPYSIEELVVNMTKLIKCKKLREKFIKRGYQNIKKFTWEKSAKKLEKIYDEL